MSLLAKDGNQLPPRNDSQYSEQIQHSLWDQISLIMPDIGSSSELVSSESQEHSGRNRGTWRNGIPKVVCHVVSNLRQALVA